MYSTNYITQNPKVLLLWCPVLALGEGVVSVLHILGLLILPPDLVVATRKESL